MTIALNQISLIGKLITDPIVLWDDDGHKWISIEIDVRTTMRFKRGLTEEHCSIPVMVGKWHCEPVLSMRANGQFVLVVGRLAKEDIESGDYLTPPFKVMVETPGHTIQDLNHYPSVQKQQPDEAVDDLPF